MVPASAVQKDAHETEDEEAADSTPAGSATFFLEINHIFYGHSLPSVDSRREFVSFWRKNVHNTG